MPAATSEPRTASRTAVYMGRMEHWRQVEGYPRYFVSRDGLVRRRNKDGYRQLKALLDSGGYAQVCLFDAGKSRRVLVHALVAAAFLGPRPSDRHQINHRNGNKGDNRLENLEYLTRRQNLRHAIAAGLWPRGQRNGATSLTDADVAGMKARLRSGWPQAAVAARHGVHRSLVNRIATGESWGWLEPVSEAFDAFVIQGRRTACSRWRFAGCEDSLPAADLAVAAMKHEWHELRVVQAGEAPARRGQAQPSQFAT